VTPGGGGGAGGITPGAMSTAMGTPYTRTPVGYGAAGNVNTPYTPSGQTPVLTPYNTPGPSMTPRHHPNASGSNTPRSRGYGGQATPRGGFGQGQTPVLTPFNTPGPRSGVNTPRQSGNQGRPGVFGTPGGSSSRQDNPRQQQRDRDRASRFGGTPSSVGGGNKRTPKGSYGDATPLYDE